MRVLPGDPLAIIQDQATGTVQTLSAEELQRVWSSLGLNDPYHVQYLRWMGDVLSGDFGRSFWRNEPIRDLILRRAPISLQIAVMAVAISWLIGVPRGLISATR